MLKSFEAESFKSLENVEVELGRVNVFIGANGSGKSNLLEALGVLGAAANGRVDDEALLRRGVRRGFPGTYKSINPASRVNSDPKLSASRPLTKAPFQSIRKARVGMGFRFRETGRKREGLHWSRRNGSKIHARSEGSNLPAARDGSRSVLPRS
jgi:energy-coupling factor transporter ATP-binding protein EcfA2